MKFLYIDKANCFNQIQIAERSIWGYEIPQMGYKVFYLLKNFKKSESVKQKCSNNIYYVPVNKIFGLSTIIFIYKLINIIVSNNIKIVVVRNTVDLALMTLIVEKLLNRKMLYIKAFPTIEFKLSKSEKKNKYKIKSLLLRLLLKVDAFTLNNCDYVISRTDKYSELLKNEYGVNKTILSIPMGIDKRSITKVSEQKQSEYIIKYGLNNVLTAIYFGTLIKERNIEFIINLIQKVVYKRPKIKCFIIGSPIKNLINLEKLAKKRGLIKNFIFIRSLSRIELFNYIKIADFALSPIPPISEYILSSPTKVLESLALGCPVIGNEEIFDQKQVILDSKGGIVIPYNENIFAQTVLQLFNSKERLIEMGISGSKYVFNKRNYSKLAQDIITHIGLNKKS